MPTDARILVVDSDDKLINTFKRFLGERIGLRTAHTVEEGLAALQSETFCLIAATDRLPWLGGVAFLQSALAAQPHAARILVGKGLGARELCAAINHARPHLWLAPPLRAAAVRPLLEQEINNACSELQRLAQAEADQPCLIDPFGQMPTRARALPCWEAMLQAQGDLGIVVVDATPLWAYLTTLSDADAVRLRRTVAECIRTAWPRILRADDVLVAEEAHSWRFWVALQTARDGRAACAGDAQIVARRLQGRLNAALQALFLPRLPQSTCHALGTVCLQDMREAPRITLLRTCDALRSEAAAAPRSLAQRDAYGQALRTLLQQRRVRTLFQPIIHLESRSVIGYEALSRGPAGGILEAPDAMLATARRENLTLDLDRLLRANALTHAVELPPDKLIFINTLTSTAHDPDLAAARLGVFLRHLGIAPQRLVFEFSERCDVSHNDAWVETLKRYRALGVQLALDDVGAGYSGLARIMAVQPDFLKIDRALVQNVHKDAAKRNVLRALQQLAEGFGAQLIAEGIEHADEAKCLRALGMTLGQGHLLGRPAHAAPRSWFNMALPS